MTNDRPFVASAKRYLDMYVATGRYSTGLTREIDAHAKTANIFPILEEIGALEGVKTARLSRTKPADEFTGRLLKGLWHKHYTQAQFMRESLARHWTRTRFRRLIKNSSGGREFFDAQAVSDLSEGFVQGYIERGSEGRLTGEWVVFAKQGDVNYYLTLGTHTEEDEAIWRRCKACAPEFPGLPILQEDR